LSKFCWQNDNRNIKKILKSLSVKAEYDRLTRDLLFSKYLNEIYHFNHNNLTKIKFYYYDFNRR